MILSAPIILAPGPLDQLDLGPAVLAGVLYGLVFCWALAPGSSFWRCAFLLDNYVGRQIALLRARLFSPTTHPPAAGRLSDCAVAGSVNGSAPHAFRGAGSLTGSSAVESVVLNGDGDPGVSHIPDPRSADPIENVGVST